MNRRGSSVDVPVNRSASQDISRSPIGLLDGITDGLETPDVNHHLSNFDTPPSTLPPEPPRSFLYRNVHKSPQKSIQEKLIDFEPISTQGVQFDQMHHEQVAYDVPSIPHRTPVQHSNQVKTLL